MTTPKPEPTIRVLSLGAGVQSTTLALMAAAGILPQLDYAIFADTGWEPRHVYEHLDKLTAHVQETANAFPVFRVSKGNLRDDLLAVGPGRYASIPYHVRNPDGTIGIGRRQCTREYKLDPIRRAVRELLGAKPPGFRSVPKGRVAEQWIGFSTDEIGRVSDSWQVRYCTLRYPLLELGMSRKDCERWLRSRGWTSVAKSACIGCPLHGNRMWRELRERPEEWADAVEFDAQIRKGGRRGVPLAGDAFLHHACVPLAEAKISKLTARDWGDKQTDIFDAIAEAAEEGDPDGCSPYGCRSGSPA